MCVCVRVCEGRAGARSAARLARYHPLATNGHSQCAKRLTASSAVKTAVKKMSTLSKRCPTERSSVGSFMNCTGSCALAALIAKFCEETNTISSW